MGLLSDIWNWIKDKIVSLIRWVIGPLVEIAEWVRDNLFIPLGNFFSDMWGYLNDIWANVRYIWDRYKWLVVLMLALKFFAGKYFDPIFKWYNKNIKPTVTWLTNTLKSGQKALHTLESWAKGKADWLYNFFFGELDGIRKDFVKLSGTVADVAAIFDKKLADKIRAVRDDFNKHLKVLTSDFIDYTKTKIHETFKPLNDEINKVRTAVQAVTDPFHKLAQAWKSIIPPTIEKPQLLTKETMKNTGEKYGMDFINSTVEVGTPEVTPQDQERVSKLELDKIITDQIDQIDKGKKGAWGDLYQCIDEEIAEISTGKPLRERTNIVLPKVEVKVG